VWRETCEPVSITTEELLIMLVFDIDLIKIESPIKSRF